MTSRLVSPRFAASLVLTATLGLFSSAALADGAHQATPKPPLYKTYVWNAAKKARPARNSGFRSAEIQRIYVRRNANGRGSYICSAAGSGLMSRCFAR